MKARLRFMRLAPLLLAPAILAQEPVELFSDSVSLADGYLRIAPLEPAAHQP